LKALSEDGWIIASTFGKISPEDILEEVGGRLLGQFQKERLKEDDPRRQLAIEIRRPDVDWKERFRVLAEYLLPERPLILLLDNFEDNFNAEVGTGFRLENEDLADLLAGWLLNPGRCRLLITSRQ